jgi:hypothetical protein
MLLIIELLFLVAGLWAIISGKIPTGLFKFLFGKGEYELPSNKTRLFGLLLSSPLPASFLVSFILTIIFGTKGTGYAVVFEYIYILTVIILSTIIARKTRHPGKREIDNSQLVPSTSDQKTSSYGVRLLIIFGIVILGCVTITSGGSLLMVIISSMTVGTRWTGNFWEDIFPFILMIAIAGIGLFGIFKLAQVLRKKT